jgi:hypothetical protein
MNTRKRTHLSLLASGIGAVAGIGIGTAQADIQYTQETRMAGETGGQPFSKMVIYKRPGAERTETTHNFSGRERRSVTITQCAKKELYTLDPELKLYYVTPMVKSTPANKPVAVKAAAGQKTGSMTMTLVSLRDLGVQKVGQFNTRGYEVVTRMQTSGCMGNSDRTTKQQIWVTPEASLASGRDGCTDITADYSTGANSCKTAMIRKGNWAGYDKITRGLQVRTRIFKDTGSTVQMETQTSKVSRVKLPGTLFAVPSGFRRVSSTEFQQAQSQAMMQSMQTQQDRKTISTRGKPPPFLRTERGNDECD